MRSTQTSNEARAVKRTLLAVFCMLLAGPLNGYTAFAQENGAIAGRITLDGSGDDFAGAEVLALGNGQTFYAFSAEDGSYRIDVPAGHYIVGARVVKDNGTNVYTEYYDDAATLLSATVITVESGQEVRGVNFFVPDLPNVVPAGGTITISGKVRDALTGDPILGATIMVNDYDGVALQVDTASTDAAGFYSLNIPSYVQRLKAWTFAVGYDRQFYDRQPSHHVANEIIVDPAATSKDDIDFELVPRSQTTAGKQITGLVENEDGIPVNGALVVAFNAASSETRSGVTDREGRYSLGGLDGGSYYVLVVADGFVPQFFGGGQSWNTATIVRAEGTTADVDFLIGGLNRPPIGKGEDGNGHAIATALSGHALDRLGEPINLALILATDANGTIVGFDVSDSGGFFKIENLPAGAYTVISDRVHYAADTRLFELADASHFVQASAFMTMGSGSTIATDDKDLPDTFTLDQNYPNPFNPATVIPYVLTETGDVVLSVYDALGRRIATLVGGPQPSGTHSVRFAATDDLAAGVYFYRLHAAGRTITRAMLLLK